jgi:hypothetical protein
MGDPISIAGLALAIPPIISNLISYYSDVKNAGSEIQQYAADLFSLKGILEYAESVRAIQSANDVYKFDSSDFALLVKACAEALQSLHVLLETRRTTSSLHNAMHRMTWNHKKAEVKGYFERLERLKSGFLTIMMGDSL